MNYQTFKKHKLIDWLLSISREKGGLQINETQLFKIIKDNQLLLKISDNRKKSVLINEIEYEEYPRILLASIGAISSTCDFALVFDSLYKKYDSFDKKQFSILKRFVNYLDSEIGKNVKTFRFDDYIESIIDSEGIFYLPFTIDVINSFTEHYISSPNTLQGKYPKITPIKLDELFKREEANSEIGNFFDQRYIDYLYKNFNDLSKIHWRKFEELTAEFFERQGYSVTLGTGRKDGGIDIKIRKDNQLIIVQCKRWRDAVGVQTIKALDSDIRFGNASLGMIVSIKGVSKDSQKIIRDRNYKIIVFDQTWIFEKLNEYRSSFKERFLL